MKDSEGVKLFYVLLSLTLIFVLFGIIMVYSASQVSAFRNYGDSMYYLKKQAIWGVLGILCLLFFSKYDYRRLQKTSIIWLIVSVILLVIVLIPGIGKLAGGARRWLVLGPVSIQPSEFAKLAVLIYMTDLFVRKQQRLREFKHLLIPFGPILLAVCGLVLAEPDLGTAGVICAIGITVMFLAGARFWHVATIVFTGFVGVAMMIALEGYRRERLLSFLNPWKDPYGSGFHIIQSMIAFGTGGIQGLGLGMSRQKFFYLPAAHTDFIFAIIGEELGLAGSLVFIILMIIFVINGFLIARRAPDLFGRVLAFGIVTLIAGQAFLNIAAVTGLVPVTGIPLPFVSSGGSSLLVLLASIGILLNISISKKRSVVAKKPTGDHNRRRDSRTRLSGNRSGRSVRTAH